MVVTLGPLAVVEEAGSARARPVSEFDGSGMAVAPVAGRTAFRVPIIVPKTAAGIACEATIRTPYPCVISLGDARVERLARGGEREVRIGEEFFRQGADLVIEELPFSDFSEFDLRIEVEAPAGERARLDVALQVDFRLPVESASDYLNYVMTQA